MASIVAEGIGTFAAKATPELGYPSVASNGTCFVAVSFDGVTNPVLRSTDGNTWAAVNAGTASQAWNYVMWVEELTLFVAFSGTSGTTDNVMTSPTGETWTLRTASDDNWISAAWNGTTIVAIGEGGAVQTSTNGTSWTTQSPTGFGTGMKTVAFGNSVFVAMNISGTIYTATNGIAWTVRDTLTNIGTPSVVWSDGLSKFFVLVEEEFEVTGAGVYESTAGLSWTLREFGVGTATSTSVLFVSPTGALVAGEELSTEYFTSDDGVTWTLGEWEAGDWAAGVWDSTLGVAVVGYNYDFLAAQFATGDNGVRVTGLTHLEGEAVSVVADGVVIASPNNPDYDTITVTGGAITLPAGTYTSVTVGLPYVTDIQTLDLDMPQSTSKPGKFLITSVGAWVEETLSFYAGPESPTGETLTLPSGGAMQPFQVLDSNENAVTTPQTGYRVLNFEGRWGQSGSVFIRNIDPTPLTVLALVPYGTYPR